MPASFTTSSELLQACATIFGPEIIVSYDFLEDLQTVGIKTAYRKRALETHPDRAAVLDALPGDLNSEFINVRQAYETLLSFVETKQGLNIGYPYFDDLRASYRHTRQSYSHHKSGHRKGHGNPKHKNHFDHFYTGSVPHGNLMMGQFLYYSGLISWQTLIEAICWQRRQRPLIGQIATAWGLISYQDVLRILRIRIFDEKFGECALRIGYISSFELLALVGKQKKLQRPFGEYFIESGILSPGDILNIAQKQQLHNMTSSKWKE